MHNFSNPNIHVVTEADIPVIKDLLDSAYRGESSKEGWTNEAHLIAGTTRTSDEMIGKVMRQPNSIFLKYVNAEDEIIGCANLQQHGNKLYLGMFSVSPKLQGGGIGKQILQASEEHATHLHCTAIYMSVISVRADLINWYQRHGYADTGKREPFIEDKISGKHLQPLEFMILEKPIP